MGLISFKVVGRAVATKRGHYPVPGGGSKIVPEGETFDVFEGLTKATWFTPVAPEKPKAEHHKKVEPQKAEPPLA